MKKIVFFAALFFCGLSAANSQIYFDVNGATPGFGTFGTSFEWNATNPLWTTSAAGDVATVPWSNASGTTTFSSSANSTVTVGANFSLSGLAKAGTGWNLTLQGVTGGSTLTMVSGSTISVQGNQLRIQDNLSLAGNFEKTGNGILFISGSGSASGNWTITEGTVQIQNNTKASAVNANLNGGTLTIASTAVSMGRLSGTSGVLNTLNDSTNRAVTFNQTSDASYAGSIEANTGTGTFGITKSGSAALTLSGTVGHDGATTVSNGALYINGNSSAATGAVSVASGATLGGNGTIGGSTTVTGSLAAGASGTESVGLLTFNDDLSLNSGSTAFFELNGTIRGTGFDAINVLGDMTYDGVLTLKFGFTPIIDQEFLLFDVAGSVAGNFSSLNFLDGGYAGTFNTSTGTLTITAIPEPSVLAIFVAAMLGVIAYSRRRRV